MFNSPVSDTEIIRNLSSHLKNRIFGQDHVVEEVVDLLTVSFAGMGDENRPLASFLFTGPTGVGKTELAKELANCLDLELIRFDMSEYSDEYAARNLTGGHKGLVGYDDGGLLTNAVMETPHAVLLLDEIEKAHPSIYNAFLQVLDYATLTDTKGNKADFSNCIIIMTSNLGAKESRGIGFGNDDLYRESAVAEFLTPEFRNRIDRMLEFRSLDRKFVGNVTDKFLKDFAAILAERHGVSMEVTPKAKEKLTDIGFNSSMGARSIRRAIDREFKQILAKEVLYGRLEKGGHAVVDATERNFVFRFEKECSEKSENQSDMPSSSISNEIRQRYELDELLHFLTTREKTAAEENPNIFSTALEAQEYARKHPGVWVRRRKNGEGYEVINEIKKHSVVF